MILFSTYKSGVLQDIQTNTSGGDWDETVFYELSCGYYVTSDGKIALPNYLVHLPSHNDVIMEMDVEEELN